jgi:hypothetical protein
MPDENTPHQKTKNKKTLKEMMRINKRPIQNILVPRKTNQAGYFTKHHPLVHHVNMRADI